MRPSEAVVRFVTDDGRSVTIRALKRSDLDSLFRFASTISKEKKTNRELGIVTFDGRATKEDERDFLNRILRERKKGKVVSLVAVSGGDVVGHADVWRRGPRDVRHTGVFGIVIEDGYREVGIGEQLMNEVLRESRRKGIWLVELTVFAINMCAIRLYRKMGFRRVGVIPHKGVRGDGHFDEVAMYVDLRRIDKSTSKGRGHA